GLLWSPGVRLVLRRREPESLTALVLQRDLRQSRARPPRILNAPSPERVSRADGRIVLGMRSGTWWDVRVRRGRQPVRAVEGRCAVRERAEHPEPETGAAKTRAPPFDGSMRVGHAPPRSQSRIGGKTCTDT